jgi:hypothetical protein
VIPVYHAAPASALGKIKDKGLTPRGEERSSNFGFGIASLPEFVYLSRFKALNYSLTAGRAKSDRVAILEVAFEDLNPELCFPDEDSIAFGMMEAEGSFGGPQHTQRFDALRKDKRPDDYRADFDRLFEKFGLIAYKGIIPFSLVRRYLLAPLWALKNVADVVSGLQPAPGDIAGHRSHGAAIAEFMFNGTMPRLPGTAVKALRKQRRLFTIQTGPRASF